MDQADLKLRGPPASVKKTKELKQDVVADAFGPSTREARAGGSLWVWGRPGLRGEFQDIQGC